MSCLPSALPHEVWEDVFYWATFSEARAASYVLGSPGSNVFTDSPFAHLYDADVFVSARKALAVKYALALVCPLWRSLSRRFLLEEIWIDGHGVESLEDLLERDDGLNGKKLGSLVRCARIQVWNPRSMPVYVSLRTGHILALCPRIRFLIIWRCFAALPHRKRFARCRIDIAFRDVKMPKLVYAQLRGSDMSPFHWRDISVPDCVVRSSCLRTLSLRGKIYWGTKILEGKIRTLDYDCSSWLYLSRMDLDLPTLDRLILRTPLTSEEAGWQRVRVCITSVRCLEIGDNKLFHSQSGINSLLHFLSTCPGLKSFYYPIPSIECSSVDQALLEETESPHALEAIRTIGLHAGKEPIQAEDAKMIINHLLWLSRKYPFSALDQVVLCGHEWQRLHGIPWFPEALDRIEEAGISVKNDPGMSFV